MRVLLASPRCYCAGVDRAVKIVELAIKRFGEPVYVRKEIVHNSHVVGRLRERGAIFVEELAEVPEESVVILSAHGVFPEVIEEASQRSLQVIDATCPLVRKVHLEVKRFVDDGHHIVLIGQEGHDEVIGTIGHAPGQVTLIEDLEQAKTKEVPHPDKLAVLTQTTRGVDDTREIMQALEDRFGVLKKPAAADICYATQNRQNAVKGLCDRGIDLLLVIGSKNSSNAARLLEVGKARGVEGFLIDGPDELESKWLDSKEIIGVTGGASTPEHVVQQVVSRLKESGATEVETCTAAEEDTVFELPALLRQVDASFAQTQ